MYQLGRNVITSKATYADVLREMDKASLYGSHDPVIKRIARKLNTGSGRYLRLFRYAYQNATYEPDPKQYQRIRTPRRMLKDTIANCVDYSVFISSVLRIWGVPHYFILAGNKPNMYSHVYVKIKNGPVLDCVIGQNPIGLEKVVRKNKNGYFNRLVKFKYVTKIKVI